MSFKTVVIVGMAALGVAGASPYSGAQPTYPSKPIKIIAPVQPGGGVDLVARQTGDGRPCKGRRRAIRAHHAEWKSGSVRCSDRN